MQWPKEKDNDLQNTTQKNYRLINMKPTTKPGVNSAAAAGKLCLNHRYEPNFAVSKSEGANFDYSIKKIYRTDPYFD